MKRKFIKETLLRLGAWAGITAASLGVAYIAELGLRWEQKAYLAMSLLVMVLALWPTVYAIVCGPRSASDGQGSANPDAAKS